MMQRLAQLVQGEIRGLHNAAYILGLFAVLSSLLGFFRDRLLAYVFGAGAQLDIYYAAFRLPDFIFVMVASLVSAYVLIPEFVKRSDKERAVYIETVMFWFSVFIALASVLAFYAAPYLLQLTFPSLWSGVYGDELLLMTRIMLLQPALLGCSNIVMAVIQAKNRYVLFALSPLLYNIGIIVGIVALYPIVGLSGLAWGVVLGALLHVLIPLPSVLSDGFFRNTFRIHHPALFFRTILISLPRTFALSANQVVFFVLVALAGTLSVGSIAIFTLAFNLQSVPLAVIGVSYSVAAFPTLVAMYSAGKRQEFVLQMSLAARHVIFWTLPMIGLIIVLRAHIVRIILGSGSFDWSDTRLTAAALALFAVAITAHALMSLLARAYYATGRSWTPFFVNIGAGCVAIFSAYVWTGVLGAPGELHKFLETVLRVSGVPGTEVLALPLAYAFGAIVGTVALAILFEIEFGGFLKKVARVFCEGLLASLVGGAAAYGVLTTLGGVSEATTLPLLIAHGFLAGSAGVTAVVLTYMLTGSRELLEMRQALQKRFVARSRIVSSVEDEIAA